MISINRYFSLFILFVISIYAQPESINFSHFNVKNGLSQNSVYSILQDSKGFLWVGTKDGLNKYDGYSFKEYKNKPNNLNTISDNFVRSIHEDSNHLWIGTEYGGLNIYDRKKDLIRPVEITNPTLAKVKSILTMLTDSEGNLLICTKEYGIIKYNLHDKSFTALEFKSKTNQHFPYKNVQSMLLEKNDILWVGFSDFDGLARINLKTFEFQLFKQSELSKKDSRNSINSIYRSTSGILWLAAVNGLSKYDYTTNNFEHFPLKAGKESSHLNAIVEDELGDLWITSTQYGLCKFNPKTNNFIFYKTHEVKRHLFEQLELVTIYKDRTGSMWIGSNGDGLGNFQANRKFKNYLYIKSEKSILSSNSVRAICIDQSNTLWVGDYGGLSSFDRNTDKLSYYGYEPNNPKSIQNNNIYALLSDRENTLWVGTEGEGLYKFLPKNKQFLQILNQNDLDMKFVYELYEDSKGIIWVGANGALLKIGKDHVANEIRALEAKSVYAIHEDKNKNLWIGTETSGIFQIKPSGELIQKFEYNKSNPNSLASNKIKSIFKDSQNKMWIGTNGSGLDSYTDSTNSFSHFNMEAGLPNDVIYGILEDSKQNLWLSSNHGLSKFNLADYSIKNYSAGDGLQSNEFNTGAFYKSKEGEMFFGGINGLNTFFPERVIGDSIAPKIQITEFRLLNKKINIGLLDDGRVILKNDISETESLILNYSDKIISFEFSALSIHSAMQNKYAYKLINFNDDWVYTNSKNRVATFTNIEPGDYTFIVKGSNGDGVWNNTGRSLKIIVLPPYWATWWAYSIYIFLLLLSINLFIKWRIYSTQKITKQLKLMVEKKTNELNEQNFEIQKQYDLISGVIESLSDPFYVIDVQQNKIIIENTASRESILKSKLSNFEALSETIIKDVLKTNEAIFKEAAYTNDCGKLVDLEIAAYPVINKKGATTQVIKYWKNISDRKALERSINFNLQLKSNELKSKIIHASNLREQLILISSSIEAEIKKNSNSATLKKINKRFEKLISEENDEFLYWYGEENKDFFAKLHRINKSLTKRQLRICSLLKLNLNTKEIAEIFQLSVKTVEVYRSQIRLKLRIPKDENLNKFLSEL